VHHRWCTRHFVSNFYRACGSKELADDLQDCCLAFTARHFTKLYNRLYGLTNDGGKEFLRRNMTERSKWARAYDYGGMRYGDMTSNMAECFNSVMRGVRQLPVTAIAEYTCGVRVSTLSCASVIIQLGHVLIIRICSVSYVHGCKSRRLYVQTRHTA
jgi:hypothetical protein